MFRLICIVCLAILPGYQALAACGFGPEPLPKNTLVIKNAQLVDPEKKSIVWGHLAIHEKKIFRIAECSLVPKIPKGIRQIDLGGKWLLPGLMDLHVHNWGDNVPPKGAYGPDHDTVAQEEMGHRMLMAGQTTYLDLFAPNDAGDDPARSMGANIFDLRTRQRRGDITHPNLYVAGPLFVVEGGHAVAGFPDAITLKVKDALGNQLTGDELISAVASTRAKVRELIVARHPDVVKFVYDSHKDSPLTGDRSDMPLAIAQAIIDEAKMHGVKTIAHVGSWPAVGDLADLGLTAFTHFPHGAAPRDVLDKLVRNKVWAISTISIYSDIGDMKVEPRKRLFLENSLLKLIAPLKLLVAYWFPEHYDDKVKALMDWSFVHNEWGSQREALLSLHRAGVPVVAGSDGGNVGTIIGYTLHRELVLMQEFGMDKWEVLRTATLNPSTLLENDRGKLKVGTAADLLVVSGNPIENLSNLQSVDFVFLAGELLDFRDWEISP